MEVNAYKNANSRNPIFSPLSGGKQNPNILRIEMRHVGIIKLNVKNSVLRLYVKSILLTEKKSLKSSNLTKLTVCLVPVFLF